MTLHLSLSDGLERALRVAADRAGEPLDALASKALLAYLEDLEDYAAAVEALRELDRNDTVPLAELLARYDVAD